MYGSNIYISFPGAENEKRQSISQTMGQVEGGRKTESEFSAVSLALLIID